MLALLVAKTSLNWQLADNVGAASPSLPFHVFWCHGVLEVKSTLLSIKDANVIMVRNALVYHLEFFCYHNSSVL